MTTDPLHHLQKRKRIHVEYQKYPHPNKLRNFFDKLIYVVGIFVPAMTFLQLYKIYEEQTAAGISTIAFGGYLLANIIWIIYGVLHKERPIIFMYVLLAIFNSLIVIGTFIY